MTKRLSPERIAGIRDYVDTRPLLVDDFAAELFEHIDAIEADAKVDAESFGRVVRQLEKELADAKAEIARLRAHCENYP